MVRQHDTYLKRSLNLKNEIFLFPIKGNFVQWFIISNNIDLRYTSISQNLFLVFLILFGILKWLFDVKMGH